MTPTGHLDTEACYRAVKSRDRRFDGVFYTAVRTTGIYCRPSCPARTPASGNVSFHPTAASAHSAGYRACKRCLPDATPGSPEWDVAADVAGRAMRLIADGLVDREGVGRARPSASATPRATSAGCSARSSAPLRSRWPAPAAPRRARVLIETTDLPLTDVAFAAGFASVRQFNETVREVYDASPSQLRGRGRRASPRPPPRGGRRCGWPVRTPFAGRRLLDFLAFHVVPGVEVAGSGLVRPHPRPARTVRGTVRLAARRPARRPAAPGSSRPSSGSTTCATPRPPASAYAACSTPTATRPPSTSSSAPTRCWATLVRATPGLRVPGQVDGDETAVRTVIGQQVSVAGARTVAGRIVADARSARSTSPVPGLTHLFPDAATLAASTRRRCRCRAPGAGHWSAWRPPSPTAPSCSTAAPTATTYAVRCWRCPASGPGRPTTSRCVRSGHPDVFLPTDLAVRRVLAELRRLGRAGPRALAALALVRADAPVEHPDARHVRALAPMRRTDMWTVMPSPDRRPAHRRAGRLDRRDRVLAVPAARRRTPARRPRRTTSPCWPRRCAS